MSEQELIQAIADMREEEAVQMVRDMMAHDVKPAAILDAVRKAMDIIGERYEKGVYFLPELILAGEIMSQIVEILKPKLVESPEIKRYGRVVIGTVKGDIHDIGKNIVTFMLDANGFEVLDLGVDVPPEKFVEAVREFQPQVVGLSGFLTLAFDSMRETIQALERAGLRDKVKVMIGGGSVDEHVRAYTGADAFGKDAVAGVALAKKWIGVQ
ncbi:MAG: corrinoid protein [Anaerolineae bacterium]|nr:corrinoid protein [Anaerolineae bacterium]MCX8068514.1 corrinoid protein [Anaerolineae bacterium]MDW7991804.1 corrinoid protein [Anaerolineae bacterium]